MTKERTFIAIKPDGVQRGYVSEIIGRFEKKGFKFSECMYCEDETRYNAYKEIKNDLE